MVHWMRFIHLIGAPCTVANYRPTIQPTAAPMQFMQAFLGAVSEKRRCKFCSLYEMPMNNYFASDDE